MNERMNEFNIPDIHMYMQFSTQSPVQVRIHQLGEVNTYTKAKEADQPETRRDVYMCIYSYRDWSRGRGTCRGRGDLNRITVYLVLLLALIFRLTCYTGWFSV